MPFAPSNIEQHLPPATPATGWYPRRAPGRSVGQPVLIGGSMGTCSYVMVGTEGAMQQTFGSTCHGAGRAVSRSRAMKQLDSQQVGGRLGGWAAGPGGPAS